MIAMAAIPAALAILVIAALTACLIIRISPVKSKIFYEGVFEDVYCPNYFAAKAELAYSFATPYKYRFRNEEYESLFYFEETRRLPIAAENLSGDYIPCIGHNIRIVVSYNFFDELISYRIERLPDWNPDVKVLEPLVFPDYPDF